LEQEHEPQQRGRPIPDWGFSSSPLVVDDLVIVAVSGKLVAYDRGSGTPRWISAWGGGSHSSPQLFTIDGVAQVVLTGSAPSAWRPPMASSSGSTRGRAVSQSFNKLSLAAATS
jgi:hypothetical protein